MLSDLATQGYRMSVIANSDGPTAQVFQDLGLAHYFERILGSKILGAEKPDLAILEVTLRGLNVSPANVLYIGDIFYVDVLGANQPTWGASTSIHWDYTMAGQESTCAMCVTYWASLATITFIPGSRISFH